MPILTIFIEEDDPNFQVKPPATSGIHINPWGNEYKHYIYHYIIECTPFNALV